MLSRRLAARSGPALPLPRAPSARVVALGAFSNSLRLAAQVLVVAGLAVRRRDDRERSAACVSGLLAARARGRARAARLHSRRRADFKLLATARWLLVGAGGFGALAGAANAAGDVYWGLARVRVEPRATRSTSRGRASARLRARARARAGDRRTRLAAGHAASSR